MYVQAYTSSIHCLLAENIFMDQMDGQLLGYGNRERQLSHRESKHTAALQMKMLY